MPQTLEEFLKEGPRKQEVASCGHVLDVLDKEIIHEINGNTVCTDCYFLMSDLLV